MEIQEKTYNIKSVRIKLCEKTVKYSTTEITSPDILIDYVNQIMKEEPYECVYLIGLSPRKTVGVISRLSDGDSDMVQVPLKKLFSTLLLANCTNFIIGHNHPSGNPEPSRYDDKVTKRLIKAGEILDVTLTDHIIFGRGKNYSYFEHHPEWFQEE